MSNTLTAVAMVNSMTSNDYSSGSVASAVESTLATSFVYASAVKGDTIVKTGSDWTDYIITDEGEAMSVAMLAEAILKDGRRVLQSRSFGSGNALARSTSKLFTQEMKDMLIFPDELDDEQWDFSNEQPTESWDVT